MALVLWLARGFGVSLGLRVYRVRGFGFSVLGFGVLGFGF